MMFRAVEPRRAAPAPACEPFAAPSAELSRRRWLAGGAALAAALALPGCATWQQLSASVSTWGEWPAGRAPGTYAFERLPSQQSRADVQQTLEDAAASALERVGFRPAAPGEAPEYLVQVGARVDPAGGSPWDDPLWWHGGFGSWGRRRWGGLGWGVGFGGPMPSPRYSREVALLIRERDSGRPLHEARASHEGFQVGMAGLAPSLFDAALRDFPAAGLNPRQVVVPIR